MDDYIPYVKHQITEEDISAVADSLRAPLITRGPLTESFEQTIADYCGARYAVAFNSCTTGLIAAAHAAGVDRHDRYLTSPNTFVATVTAGCHRGAVPVFIDIDAVGNLDLQQLGYNAEVQSTRGRNIYVPVHFAGVPVDMEALEQMITDPEAVVIEDAAHAIGSEYKDGLKVGCCAWSDMTVFSFHPAKNITTGEGGMVLTNDEELYRKLRLYRNNGIEKDPRFLSHPLEPGYYEVVELTGNTHMTEMQAALGLSQFKRLEQSIKRRSELMALYRELTSGLEHVHLLHPADTSSIMYHLCVAQIDFEALGTTRAKVMQALHDKGIGTQVHYIPVYRHPVFRDSIGDISEYFPATENYYRQALSLPLYSQLTDKQVRFVIDTLQHVIC